MTAFNGVRSSWLMAARKSLFDWLAASLRATAAASLRLASFWRAAAWLVRKTIQISPQYVTAKAIQMSSMILW